MLLGELDGQPEHPGFILENHLEDGLRFFDCCQ
jgi:hypothetical protein